MIKAIPLLILSLFIFQCGRKRIPPSPTPTPTPTPFATPTPDITPTPTPAPSPSLSPTPPTSPIAWATPYPTPAYDPASYIPPVTPGTTVRVFQEGTEDYSAKIQSAQNNPEVGTVIIGPGSLKRPVVLKKRTQIDTTPAAPLACDLTEPLPEYARLIAQTDYGCFLIADGVHVSGTYKAPIELIEAFAKGNLRDWANDPYFKKLDTLTEEQIAGTGSTILEPTYIGTNKQPQVAVFQALGDVLGSHTGKAANIAITGIVIKGRQTLYDGGVRSSIQFGNCAKCTAQDVFLWDTASIGITAGGSALEKNNFASSVLFYRNIFKGVPGANMASINTDGMIAANNYVRRPGNARRMLNAGGLVGGGGVCGFDQETNSPADHTAHIFVINNLIDFEGAYQESAGNGVCMQDPYAGANRAEVVVANNVIIGGRGEKSDHRYMSNGIFLNGLVRPQIINNYVFRTGQNAVQAYNVVGGLLQDNDFEHTGGGGNPTGMFVGVRSTIVRRSHMRSRLGLEINAQGGWQQKQGSCGNVFDDIRTNGILIPTESPACP